jgi:hypothetical protein
MRSREQTAYQQASPNDKKYGWSNSPGDAHDTHHDNHPQLAPKLAGSRPSVAGIEGIVAG